MSTIQVVDTPGLEFLPASTGTWGESCHLVECLILDDLRAAFGAEGWDSDSELLRAVDDLDKDAAVERIRDILNTGFIAPDSPLGKQGYKKISDALLPGDEEDLINLILGDMFDGDSMITLY